MLDEIESDRKQMAVLEKQQTDGSGPCVRLSFVESVYFTVVFVVVSFAQCLCAHALDLSTSSSSIRRKLHSVRTYARVTTVSRMCSNGQKANGYTLPKQSQKVEGMDCEF